MALRAMHVAYELQLWIDNFANSMLPMAEARIQEEIITIMVGHFYVWNSDENTVDELTKDYCIGIFLSEVGSYQDIVNAHIENESKVAS